MLVPNGHMTHINFIMIKNNVATSFWRHNDVVFTSYAHCVESFYVISRDTPCYRKAFTRGCFATGQITTKNGILGTYLYICVCGENANLVAAEIFKLISVHYNGVIIGTMAHKITIVSIVCPTVCSDADQMKHQSSASLAFVRGIHRWAVDYPHKWQVKRKVSFWWRHHAMISFFFSTFSIFI